MPALGIVEESFSVLTWNVMGLTTIREELQDLINEHELTIVILTETKLEGKHEHMQWVQQAFQGRYSLHFSSQSYTRQKDMETSAAIKGRDRKRQGSGGVILAIQKKWANACELTRHSYHNMPYMRGHAIGLALQLLDGPKVEVIGTYLPSSTGQDVDDNARAMHKRDRICTALSNQVQGERHVIAAGDWNAALRSIDRSNSALHTQTDIHHQQFVSDNALEPLPSKAPGRMHTFR